MHLTRTALSALAAAMLLSGAAAEYRPDADQRSFTIEVGDTVHTGKSSNVWKAENDSPNVISINEEGRIDALGVGTAKVMFKNNGTSLSYIFVVGAPKDTPVYTQDEVLKLIRKTLADYGVRINYNMRMLKKPVNKAAWDETLMSLSYKNITGIDLAFISGCNIVTAPANATDPYTVAFTQTFNYRTGGDVARSYLHGTDGMELTGKALELRVMCDNIINELDLRNRDKAKYMRVLAVHDYIVANCAYDDALPEDRSALSSDAYGALIACKATCQGYAEAIKLLLDASGIECQYVTGKTKTNGKHGWVRVKLDDGEWYNLDATADDPLPDKIGRVKHDKTFVTDKLLKDAGYKWTDVRAECTADKYYYPNLNL